MLKTILKLTLSNIDQFFKMLDKQSVSVFACLNNTPFPFRNKMPVKKPGKTKEKKLEKTGNLNGSGFLKRPQWFLFLESNKT
jgi:hypothetical protein